MKIIGTFTTRDFKPAVVTPAANILTGLATAVATMEKHYCGQIEGRSATLFSSAFDHSVVKGAYCALESFEGSLNGKRGKFNFIHSAATDGKNRTNEFFSIVDGSGTDELRSISGCGGISIDPDGTHHIWFEADGLS
ncbi:MAG: DUF3224 domain-containing protein [Rouxiella aceris]|uniref:DUF3224 domain-containing protein n=1 Tax=Rouxiella aceris TaxID=2703884 RepID=A0A848MHC6_9GAMM|nr:DUF3224 domain-containing protein [Rouxiella aceris]MDR3434308.1 DUF3224 domain-containing protein [Rouxiella aceris]NMP26569.1 DUF3224 domain-containing protein [Rouxiella aceris]